MMKRCFLIIYFITLFAFADEMKLKERFLDARAGDYIVTEQNKNFIFLHIHSRKEKSLVIEEVVIPLFRYLQNPTSWRSWFEDGACGNTSWIISQLNLETGSFEETFSFTHNGWINLTETDSFLTTLLNLPFQNVADENRHRVGIPPGHNKPDLRPFWSPCLIVDGKRVFNVPFSAWRARWPSDGSELSRKYIELYIPNVGQEEVDFPTYFPFWIELEGKIGSFKIRVMDSGKGVNSIRPFLPLRPIELLKEGCLGEDGLTLCIKAPSYYKDFLVIAEGVEDFGESYPLPCSVISIEGETIELFVKMEDLKKVLPPEKSYIFTIHSQESPHICVETHLPLLIK